MTETERDMGQSRSHTKYTLSSVMVQVVLGEFSSEKSNSDWKSQGDQQTPRQPATSTTKSRGIEPHLCGTPSLHGLELWTNASWILLISKILCPFLSIYLKALIDNHLILTLYVCFIVCFYFPFSVSFNQCPCKLKIILHSCLMARLCLSSNVKQR